MIGIGSFLFHTFATRWSAIADSTPIAIFMIVYLGFGLRRFLGAGWIVIAGCVAAFVAAGVAMGMVRCGTAACLNGSLGYAPALITLFAMTAALRWRGEAAAPALAAAGCVFAVSLVFRTIDASVCASTLIQPGWRTGTHALWHLMNAIVLYILLRAAVFHRDADRREGYQDVNK